MGTFLLSHRHPAGYRGDANTAAAWNKWFDQLDGAIVDLGNPVFTRDSVGQCGPAAALSGYTLIDANDITEARRLASSCPLLANGGGIEVGELTPVPGRQHPARIL